MSGTTGLEPKTSCVTVPREMVLPFLQKPKVSDEKVSRRLFYELRTELAIAGKNPDQIAESLQTAYVKGELPRKDGVSFSYMWSAGQNPGSGIGHWHRHMMVFCLYYENSMAGCNEFGSLLPQVSDDAGTPFTVVVISIDDRVAVKARPI